MHRNGPLPRRRVPTVPAVAVAALRSITGHGATGTTTATTAIGAGAIGQLEVPSGPDQLRVEESASVGLGPPWLASNSSGHLDSSPR